MLLVDDDEAEPLERREHRRARADDDVDVAAADALPLVVPLAVGQAAVLNGDAVAERLRGRATATAGVSAISGTSISTRRPRVADGGGQPQVDLGLAAAGHAVQQRDAKRARVGQRASAARARAACSAVSCAVRRRPARRRSRRRARTDRARRARCRRLTRPALRQPRDGIGARCRAPRSCGGRRSRSARRRAASSASRCFGRVSVAGRSDGQRLAGPPP